MTKQRPHPPHSQAALETQSEEAVVMPSPDTMHEYPGDPNGTIAMSLMLVLMLLLVLLVIAVAQSI